MLYFKQVALLAQLDFGPDECCFHEKNIVYNFRLHVSHVIGEVPEKAIGVLTPG